MATLETTDDPNQRPPVIGGAYDEGQGARRRDFLNIAAVSFAGVGAVSILIPLVNQMNPSADVLALASIEVDHFEGRWRDRGSRSSWRKQPVFVRNLTPKEIAGSGCGAAVARLRDPQTLERADQARTQKTG